MAKHAKRRTPRRAERIPFWRTVGLVIVILIGMAVIGLAASLVLVTLDEVQQWAPLSIGSQRRNRV